MIFVVVFLADDIPALLEKFEGVGGKLSVFGLFPVESLVGERNHVIVLHGLHDGFDELEAAGRFFKLDSGTEGDVACKNVVEAIAVEQPHFEAGGFKAFFGNRLDGVAIGAAVAKDLEVKHVLDVVFEVVERLCGDLWLIGDFCPFLVELL